MSPGDRLKKRVPALLALVFVCGPAAFVGGGIGLAAAQQTREVTIQEYRFDPAELRIKVGDTVKWVNREKRTSHSVLFAAENGLESERLFPQESWQRTFTRPGTYAYRCGPHEEMHGLVVVE